ncbi:unnamed protein product [Rodentolepis nana]|uniref:Chromatin modification-related protein MEAF6 n=1 Tax=Rodentolepis nana TaxID=102285 RepID=A0A0R3T0N1_RODNA|nr:unnamed protein product [Rodentolepis nana]
MPENTVANAREKLVELIRQRRFLVENLSNLERQLYQFEGNYLEETAPYGNIIKGWDRNLVTATGSALSAVTAANGHGEKRPRRYRECDRIFSHSSVTCTLYNGNGSSIRNNYDQDQRENPLTNDVYSTTQHFEDRTSENDPKIYSTGPSAKKKRRHR